MRSLILCSFLLSGFVAAAQKKVFKSISDAITVREISSHLTFLAADEMRGRDTGSPELDIAANYLMTQFMAAGVAPADGQSYFQTVSLMRVQMPSKVEFVLESNNTKSGIQALLIQGKSSRVSGDVVYVGYGSIEDFDKNNVNGKIAVCLLGAQGTTSLSQGIQLASAKRRIARERGALALVEIVAVPGMPWGALANYFSKPRVAIQEDESGIPHILIPPSEQDPLKSLMSTRVGTGEVVVEVSLPMPLPAKNVVGVIKGTDPALSQEYIAVTAHYDHVGVNKASAQDSIFNGARDNAIGTTALIQVAKFFASHPTKRSILLIAATGEEKGLLGSRWYSDHPVIPLNKTVFNLNCDGAGYNDTSIATIIDFNRTTADELLKTACSQAGLLLQGDPVPEQGLYDRSDNVNFARKGVPAVNISPGIKSFDQELMKYYHQPADEVGTLDMNYLVKFYRLMLNSVLLLGNAADAPTWKAGDKYEAVSKTLYVK